MSEHPPRAGYIDLFTSWPSTDFMYQLDENLTFGGADTFLDEITQLVVAVDDTLLD